MATSDKYDRQLRLWGANGQRKLMTSHILLVNSSAVGTETLKNLVLPGLGSFTILDDALLQPFDLGNNFFTPQPDSEDETTMGTQQEGLHRGKVAVENLCEMNPDVKGYFMNSNLQSELGKDSHFLQKFSLVIVANPTPLIAQLASASCWDSSVPLIIVRSYGFIGTFRLQIRGIHGIIESKPESEQLDLRINSPFKELEEYCGQFDLSQQDSLQHSHTPFVVILFHALTQWKKEHEGNPPKTVAQKKEFKALIESWRSPTSHGEEMNYTEAIANAHRAFAPVSIPDNIQEIFSSPFMNESLQADSSAFRILLHCLQLFIESHGNGVLCPLKGSIPDMTSTSEHYVNLQQVYLKKSTDDRTLFTQFVSETLASLNRSTNSISESDIEAFCKNISNIRSVQTNSLLQSDLSPDTQAVSEFLCDPYDDPLQTPLLYFVALRACDEFHTLHQRYPGEPLKTNDSGENSSFEFGSEEDLRQIAEDGNTLWSILQSLAKTYGIPIGETRSGDEEIENAELEKSARLTLAHAVEMTRYGGIELHNISSLMGGLTAQEAVKIITHLYVPISGTFVFNGIAGCGGTYNI